MQILLSASLYPPKVSGVAVFTHSLAKYAASHGHVVSVLTSALVDRAGQPTTYERDGVNVIELKSMKNPFHQELTFPIPSRAVLGRILDTVRPDVIHLQEPLHFNLTLTALANQRDIPVMVTHHFSFELVAAYVPSWLHSTLRLLLGWWLRRAYRGTKLVTCPSQKTAEDLVGFGITTPVKVLSNGAPIDRFQQVVAADPIRKKFHLPVDRPILMFVGRLDPDKSIDVLIRAAAIVHATRPVHLIIVGDGDVRARLESLVRRLGLDNAVTFTGWVNHDDDSLVGLYQLADLFVIASTIETQGIVVIEAMAAGLPVVAANANALPELVIEGKAGRLVEPGDAAGFAAAILGLIDRPAERKAMSQAARQAVLRHEQVHCLEQFLSLYRAFTTSSPSRVRA